MKFFIVIIALLIFQVTVSCNKTNRCTYDSPPPTPLFFKVKKNSKSLSGSTDSLKLYYITNGQKKYLTDLFQATGVLLNKEILGSSTIPILSADKDIKIFYIEYTNNWSTDTLFYDNLTFSPNTNCQYLLNAIKYNSQIPLTDTTFKYPLVYIFNKK